MNIIVDSDVILAQAMPSLIERDEDRRRERDEGVIAVDTATER